MVMVLPETAIVVAHAARTCSSIMENDEDSM